MFPAVAGLTLPITGSPLDIALGAGLLITIIGAYRFWVNVRTTERNMARRRVADAASESRDERAARLAAQREASAWQGYAADLAWQLRIHGIAQPALPDELRDSVHFTPTAAAPGDNDQTTLTVFDDKSPGERGQP